MDILVCGTAAAEGWPALFCHCPACASARAAGGKNLRTRAAYQVGDKVHIDFGPDSHYHHLQYGLPFERLEHLLVSHSHWDHWVPAEIAFRRPGFSVIPDGAVLHVYGNESVREKMEAALGSDFGKYFLQFHELQLWKPFELSDGIQATPIAATHDPGQLCVNWLLEQSGRRFLQGHDTGHWPEETWEFLQNHPLDLLLLDCTFGPLESSGGHLGCHDFEKITRRLRDSGCLNPSARVFATHFSHNGRWLHEQLEAFFTPLDIGVAFDGLRLQV